MRIGKEECWLRGNSQNDFKRIRKEKYSEVILIAMLFK